ncbi:MAG: signal peptide peptidase SppA [Halobacteriota archaeon]|nr:signal peptide peptidase SppA [Halobacteriota archaeon]
MEQIEVKKKRSKKRFVGYIILIIFIGFVLLLGVNIYDMMGGFGISREKVTVIYVQGAMVTDNIPGGLGFASSEQICREIRSASKDPFVKAIVLRVNSPGGSPAAAQEVVTEIKKTRDRIPIVISMGEVAASGAYYISAPASRIVASPDTMTGSIGVVWVFENKEGYFQEEGLNYTVIKSAEMKDMGAPWRNLTQEEEEYATHVVMESYDRFLEEVASERNISMSEVEKLADGRIYLGSDAKEYGLVDDLGNLYDAIDIAAELGGVSGTPEVEFVNQPDLFSLLFGGEMMKVDKVDDIDLNLEYLKDGPYGRILWSLD